jgi:hypothetical protein
VYERPNCGKSILPSSVVHELKRLNFQPLYFFNSKLGTSGRAGLVRLVRAFLFQLLDVDAHLIDHLYPVYVKSGCEEHHPSMNCGRSSAYGAFSAQSQFSVSLMPSKDMSALMSSELRSLIS